MICTFNGKKHRLRYADNGNKTMLIRMVHKSFGYADNGNKTMKVRPMTSPTIIGKETTVSATMVIVTSLVSLQILKQKPGRLPLMFNLRFRARSKFPTSDIKSCVTMVTNFDINKFDGKISFPIWKVHMQAVLTHHGSSSGGYRRATVAGLWLKLESLYMTNSLANKLRLKDHLYTFRMKPDTFVQDHLDEFKTILID
nr:retrovirus-related Pol polyprotein from transposon TNT 1-94 [Tanacetum cinerariifolium]